MDRSQELERAVRYFTEESGIMDSMAVAEIGRASCRERV